jgi:hypothetical protein
MFRNKNISQERFELSVLTHLANHRGKEVTARVLKTLITSELDITVRIADIDFYKKMTKLIESGYVEQRIIPKPVDDSLVHEYRYKITEQGYDRAIDIAGQSKKSDEQNIRRK